MASEKYIILNPFHNQFTLGDVATAADLAWEGATPKEVDELTEALVANKSVRVASEWEGQLKNVPAEHVTKTAHVTPPKELVEAGVVKVAGKKPTFGAAAGIAEGIVPDAVLAVAAAKATAEGEFLDGGAAPITTSTVPTAVTP